MNNLPIEAALALAVLEIMTEARGEGAKATALRNHLENGGNIKEGKEGIEQTLEAVAAAGKADGMNNAIRIIQKNVQHLI